MKQFAATAVQVLFLVAGLVAIWFAIRSQTESRDAWERLRDVHHCRIVRTEDPPAGISTTPGQTIWACDDGELIVRRAD